MVDHISKLRALQADLALMSNVVSDEDFAMIIITSLPESWDVFTTSYLGSKGTATTLTVSEIISLLMDEDRRRRARDGGSVNSLQARLKSGGAS